MTTHSLQLLDFPGNYEKGTLHDGPCAYIALRISAKVNWHDNTGKKKVGFTVITPKCVTIAEFRNQIKKLIKELETIDKQAEKFFTKDMEKMQSKFSNKS